MKLENVGPAQFIRMLMPDFVACGRVACRIQDAIMAGQAGSVDQKSGGSFAAALTDADILVEGYLGMAILARYDDIAFHGEEYATDRISGYFPKTAPYLVTLDPIDGTRYFMDGLPLFSIIMTVCKDGRMIAAVAYLPREERFYVGLGKGGAFTMTAKDALEGGVWSKYRVTEASSVVLVGEADLARKDALKQAGFTVIHGSSQYHGQPDWRHGSIRLLSGEVAGMATRDSQLIDAGAIAFIAASAGGKDNDPQYDMSTKLAPRIIAAASPATYDRIVAVLGAD